MASPTRRAGSASRHPQIHSKNSYVDEALFGSARPTSASQPAKGCLSPAKSSGLSRAGSSRNSPSCSPVAAAVAAPISGKDGAVVLSKGHLDRMMQKSPIMTPAEAEAWRLEEEAHMEEQLAKAKARRTLMAQMEEESKKALPRSEMERIRERERRAVITKAQLALLEEKEEVKQMNQMILHSKCMAARDHQVDEKHRVKQQAAEEERKLVEEMEQRRKAGLAEVEERERLRAMEQKKGALKILDQLADRERERAASDEQRRREGEDMKRRIELLKEEEQQHEVERRAAASALMDEVARGNAELAERKRLMKQAEAEENVQIAEYIRQKDVRGQELAEERERIAKQKELEVARLRAMQEKLQDNRSAQDEARAKRYQDEHELTQRRKEAAEREKREAMQRDLKSSRVSQLAAKQAQRVEMSRVQQQEFDSIMAVKRQKDEQDHVQEIARLEGQKRHQQRLLAQMDAQREMKSHERDELVAEGRRIKERLAEESNLLQAVKQLKLQELAEAGVPEKYHSQLARKQVGARKVAARK